MYKRQLPLTKTLHNAHPCREWQKERWSWCERKEPEKNLGGILPVHAS